MRSRGLNLSIQVERCEHRSAEAAQRLFLARVTAALRAASRRLRVVAALRPAARRFRVIAAFWPGVSVTLGLAFMICPFPLNGTKSRAKLIELGLARVVRTGDSTHVIYRLATVRDNWAAPCIFSPLAWKAAALAIDDTTGVAWLLPCDRREPQDIADELTREAHSVFGRYNLEDLSRS